MEQRSAAAPEFLRKRGLPEQSIDGVRYHITMYLVPRPDRPNRPFPGSRFRIESRKDAGLLVGRDNSFGANAAVVVPPGDVEERSFKK
jgi:hypothetical protein